MLPLTVSPSPCALLLRNPVPRGVRHGGTRGKRAGLAVAGEERTCPPGAPECITPLP